MFSATELLSSLVLLHHQAVIISDAINLRDTSRVFSSSQVHNEHELGQTIEFTTNTPLACSLNELDAYMVSFLTVKEAQTKHQSPNKVCSTATSYFIFGWAIVNLI